MKSKPTFKLFFFVFIAFTFITYLYFPALFTGFSSRVETNDGRFVAWALSWDIHSILTDPLHIFQANIFFPNPNTLTYSEHFIGTALWGIPVWLVSGGNPTATFNFLMITGYVLNAFFTFLLIRKLVKNNTAAFLGAFINGFCSYRLWNIGHLQNVFIFYIPLCLWFFFKFLDNKKTWPLVGIGGCVLLQSLSSWYHMIFLLLVISLVSGYSFWVTKTLKKGDLLKVIISVATACLFIIPFALPYLVQNKLSQTAYNMSDIISSDLGGYLLPPPDTFLSKVFGDYFGISKTRWLENFNFVGYVPLLFCFFGIFRFYKNKEQRNVLELNRETRMLLLVAIIFFILSLGPYFIFNDNQTSLKLPYYAIFKFLSPIRFLRGVSRYATVVLLITSILAAYGMADLFRQNSKKTNKVLSFLLLLIFAAEFTPISRFNRFTDMSKIPAVYRYIKNDSAIKALVEIPINVDPFTTTQYLYYSGIHFKPIVNGYSGYEPPSYLSFKNIFDDTLDEFASSFSGKIGVTHILCNPGYPGLIDSNFADLIMKDEGYKLYKIKNNNFSFYVEDINRDPKIGQLNDTTFKLKKEIKDILFNPASEYAPFSSISPKELNIPGFITYSSNDTLYKLYIKFRTYAPTDTLEIKCYKQNLNTGDSLVKTYMYSNNSSYLNKSAVLDLFGSNKIKFKLISSEFRDRTLIKNLVLLYKR